MLVTIVALAACRASEAPDAAAPSPPDATSPTTNTDARSDATFPTADSRDESAPLDAQPGPLVITDETTAVRITQSRSAPGLHPPDAGCFGGMLDMMYHFDTGLFEGSYCRITGDMWNYVLTPVSGSRTLTADERTMFEAQLRALRVVPAPMHCATDPTDLALHVIAPAGTVTYGMDIWSCDEGRGSPDPRPLVSYFLVDHILRTFPPLDP